MGMQTGIMEDCIVCIFCMFCMFCIEGIGCIMFAGSPGIVILFMFFMLPACTDAIGCMDLHPSPSNVTLQECDISGRACSNPDGSESFQEHTTSYNIIQHHTTSYN